ncbi:hypothetical protein QN277_021011 [Acacia crassicarpa]|uniref:Uncharacterized protein n=1 Tax=Acacia crassicarpa TaxID=499986 RepID=A0AAE1MNY9_9FABA|nr:hypothetical protein QN277_021011 [Acacia crassicarpa]
MGQAANKLTSGNDFGKKGEKVKECYFEHFEGKMLSESEFYRAICVTVEKLNKDQGYTQVKTIDEETLKEKYNHYCRGRAKPTFDEFMTIVNDLEKQMELTGLGVKETLLYIFGVPASATFIKNALMPSLVSNEILIPGMTSLTVLVLAKLKKI